MWRYNLSRLGTALGLTMMFGCGFFAPRPDVIAERFWDASMDGDYERAAEYATRSSADLLERNADDVPELDGVSLGAVEIDGDDASVETFLVATINDRATEVEFDTILKREDGQWRVDVRQTSGRLITQFVGEAAGEVMGQIGEIMGEQMRGMFDGLMKGLAEGMEEAGRALQEARPDSIR